MKAPALITYPARPIQGGRLEMAPPKRGLWYAEPKLKGWRALIHTPTATAGDIPFASQELDRILAFIAAVRADLIQQPAPGLFAGSASVAFSGLLQDFPTTFCTHL
jgi:hypothetical protein